MEPVLGWVVYEKTLGPAASTDSQLAAASSSSVGADA
jgi:hypothetical protein